MVVNPLVYGQGQESDIFSNNLESRIIHLIGEVTEEMAASVIAQLLYLESLGADDIYLYINSPGGEVNSGMAIYDTIRAIKPDVVTVCTGMAASMGAVILSGGAKGKRMALPHSMVMIHQPSSRVSGQASDIMIVADQIKKMRGMLNEVLAENCGKELEQVEADTDRNYWMSAKEAVEYGIIDQILPTRK